MSQIRTELTESTLVVIIDRPEKKNALNTAMRDELCEIFAGVDQRSDVAAVVITGVADAFSAGVDIKELAEGPPARRPTNPAAALRAMRTPSICAVNGVCVTGALEIALSADILVASERATFADTHVARGLVPAWGMTALLPRAVGTVRARELSLTGRFINAAEAHAIGLVARVVPHDELMTVALGIAREVVAHDAVVLRTVRDLLDHSSGMPFEAAVDAEAAAVRAWLKGA